MLHANVLFFGGGGVAVVVFVLRVCLCDAFVARCFFDAMDHLYQVQDVADLISKTCKNVATNLVVAYCNLLFAIKCPEPGPDSPHFWCVCLFATSRPAHFHDLCSF